MPVETVQEKLVYRRPESLVDVANHYCPGCGHGIIHKLLAQGIDELGIREKVVLVAPVEFLGALGGLTPQVDEIVERIRSHAR